jgi:hypothetical protein
MADMNRTERRAFRRTITENMRKKLFEKLVVMRISNLVSVEWARDANLSLTRCNDFGKLQDIYQQMCVVLNSSTNKVTRDWAVVRIERVLWHPIGVDFAGLEKRAQAISGASAKWVIHDEIDDITDSSVYAHQYFRQAQNSRPPRNLSPTGRSVR